jgi:hypothetical protein
MGIEINGKVYDDKPEVIITDEEWFNLKDWVRE